MKMSTEGNNFVEQDEFGQGFTMHGGEVQMANIDDEETTRKRAAKRNTFGYIGTGIASAVAASLLTGGAVVTKDALQYQVQEKRDKMELTSQLNSERAQRTNLEYFLINSIIANSDPYLFISTVGSNELDKDLTYLSQFSQGDTSLVGPASEAFSFVLHNLDQIRKFTIKSGGDINNTSDIYSLLVDFFSKRYKQKPNPSYYFLSSLIASGLFENTQYSPVVPDISVEAMKGINFIASNFKPIFYRFRDDLSSDKSAQKLLTYFQDICGSNFPENYIVSKKQMDNLTRLKDVFLRLHLIAKYSIGSEEQIAEYKRFNLDF